MTGKDFPIRPMRAADVPQVMEIAGGLRNAPCWPHSAYLAALDPDAAPRRVTLVAVDAANDFPIGYAIASLQAPQAELETVVVVREWQRLGVGRLLLDELLRELRQREICEVWLEVRESNTAAIRLYRRAGFAENGRRKRYYADPAEDAIVMHLTLS